MYKRQPVVWSVSVPSPLLEYRAGRVTVTVSVAFPVTVPREAVMVEVPAAMPVATPALELIVAREVVPDPQITCVVMSLVLASE